MSVVYRAEDLALERKVALKLLATQLAQDERFRARFQRESRLAASIDHPHIVPVYEAGEAQGQLFIAMRYVEGTDLTKLLRDEGALSPERTLALLGQLAGALDTAHERGLIHRDIKPSNVLLTRQAGTEHCYLGDFGLTMSASERSGPPTEGQIEGTVDYLAPEVIEGQPVDERSDLYALGCLLYQCLTGEAPFRRDSELATLWAHVREEPPKPSERDPSLQPELDGVITTALAKDPAERYGTAGALYAAATEPLAPSVPAASRRRWLIAGVAVLLAAALAAALAVVFTGGDSGPSTTPTLEITTGSIQKVDPATNELVATIEAPGFSAVASGGDSLWAANPLENRIVQIDPESYRFVRTIDGVGNPEVLAFGADALWALNSIDGIVTKIEPATGEVARAIPLPAGAPNAAIGASLRASDQGVWVAWLTNEGNAVRIDPRSTAAEVVQIGPESLYEVIDFAPVEEGVLWVAGTSWTPSADGVFEGIYSVDPRDLGKLENRTSANYGRLLAHDGQVWAMAPGGGINRIDARTGRIVGTAQVSAADAFAAGTDAVWVASAEDGTLSRIGLETTKVTAIPIGPNPEKLAVTAGGVWVAVRPDER